MCVCVWGGVRCVCGSGEGGSYGWERRKSQAKGSKCAFHLSEWLGSLDLASDALGITCLFSKWPVKFQEASLQNTQEGSRGL